MPSAEQILSNLSVIANTWWMLAVFWHLYFGVVIFLLIVGVRYYKRAAGILLLLPFISVSIIAWIYFNPFNGLVYALVSIVMLFASLKLPSEKVRIAPLWMFIPGIIMFAFGWIYPHFLGASSFVPYLYSSPVGLIPCATLTIVIGSLLILNGLQSRLILFLLGITGLFYGLTGVFKLRVGIDIVLLLGAIVTLAVGIFRRQKAVNHAQ
jgi:hypothetical protein